MAETLDKLLELLSETIGTPSAGGGAGWAGFYGTLGSGPQVSNPSWPFRTDSADVVWQMVNELSNQYPEMQDNELIRLAVEKSGVSPLDLTPEDWRLLEMATQWLRNGTTGLPKPRLGRGSIGGQPVGSG